MKQARNVFLVGPMGVGKTTIGRSLAQVLKKQFVDLDEEIEKRCGANIPWIFDVEGEAGFRKRESDILAEVATRQDIVLATGGGAVLSLSNQQILKENGLVVYLTASVNKLFERTQKDKRRPLLQVEDRKTVIKNLLEQRDPIYRKIADVIFDVTQSNSQASTKKLADLIIGNFSGCVLAGCL